MGQQGPHVALLQAGLAIADQILCGDEHQVGATSGTPGVDATTAHKLGLMKQFATALDKVSIAFKYLQDFFPKLCEAKVKAGVFVGPQIKILECKDFPKKLTRKEQAT